MWMMSASEEGGGSGGLGVAMATATAVAVAVAVAGVSGLIGVWVWGCLGLEGVSESGSISVVEGPGGCNITGVVVIVGAI